MMIVNTMTRGGYIMPLSRHGINRMDTGPLLRCTFEETPDILCDAACFGEIDNAKGVSQNIIAGKLASIGSGCPKIFMDSNSIHPRSVCFKNVKKLRVVKALIKTKHDIQDNIEYVCYDKSTMPESVEELKEKIELPFKDDDVDMDELNPIFSSNKLDAPFFDKQETDQKYEAPAVEHVVYRPSTPDDFL